jgi:hypothetical protein
MMNFNSSYPTDVSITTKVESIHSKNIIQIIVGSKEALKVDIVVAVVEEFLYSQKMHPYKKLIWIH